MVCHLTTAHPANDVRISFRECKSILDSGEFDVLLIAHGEVDIGANLLTQNLGRLPRSRVYRTLKAQFVGFSRSITVKAQIWHIHDPELIYVALWLRILRKKVIWDAHEDYFLQFSSQVSYRKYIPRGAAGITNIFVRASLRLIDKFSTAVVCATESIASKYHNPNVYIVGNEAIVEDFLDAEPNCRSRQILFTGTADDSQCFRALVMAVKSIPEVKIALAGRNQQSQEVLWAKNELNDRLMFLGWLDRRELVKAISESFLGVLTYENVITNDHNSPNKLFEFSAAGLPCLATPTKSNIEWNEKSDGAFLSSGFDSVDLAEAIATSMRSNEKWSQKSKSLRAWSQQHGDWVISETELLKLYESISRDIS
jgi:glycosyltransferase involved in cell wall biosynthesis